MESFNSLPEWTDAMVKRGYIYGEDGKGAFYLDKLGFKHRYRGGNKGSLLSSSIGGNGRTSNLPDWQNFGGNYYSAQAWPERDFGNNSDPGYDPQSSVIHHGNSSNPVTDTSKATDSLNFITAQPQNKFALTEFLKLGKKAKDFNKIIDDLQNHEKKSKECICVTGLTSDKFKEFFKIKNDYIFGDELHGHKGKYMKNYSTYRTRIDSFLGEFVSLFNDPYYINNCYRKAHLLGQYWVETDEFQSLIEYDSKYTDIYDPFRGRGCIHITLRENYEKYGQFAGEDFVTNGNYEKITDQLHRAVDSSGWFWKYGNPYHTDINIYADLRETDTVSRIVTGVKREYKDDVNGKKLEGMMKSRKFFERKRMTEHLLEVFNSKYCVNMKNHP